MCDNLLLNESLKEKHVGQHMMVMLYHLKS